MLVRFPWWLSPKRSIIAFMTHKQSDLDAYQAALKVLQEKFDQELAVLQQKDVSEKLDRLFAAKGKLTKRPIAGPSF